ncbi:MAG: hypothetical protein AAB371_00735 [Patescibacteria group bacterium]
MSKRTKFIIGVVGFLIGYVLMSAMMLDAGFIMQFKTGADGKKFADKGTFLQALNPFHYILNPFIDFFIANNQ